ncbi:hypothetical protein [Fusobacterium polymorphum]|uniref:hypothetical protein n=1 Tax=Fusobacterium nucleatum subsp. polymorphum TaxID=76857 RepID=UPI003009BFF4
MKKVLLILMLLFSVISFGSVKIIDTKDNLGKLTGGKSIVYKDNVGSLQLDFENSNCIAITVKTNRYASELETEIGFMIDTGYNRNLSYKIQKDKKTVKCSADSAIDAEIIKNIVYDMEKGYLLMIGYVGKDDKMIAMNIKLAEIQKAIKELKSK